MNDTLTLNKLEKLLEMETQIRAEYKPQLEEKDASIAQLSAEKATLETKIAEMEKPSLRNWRPLPSSPVNPRTHPLLSSATANCTTAQKT